MSSNVRFPQGPIADASGYVSLEWVQWFQNPQFVTLDLGTTLAVTSGGTGLTGGTSGGVLAFTASDTIASSGELQANRLVLGGGSGVAPSTPVSLGTATTVLHGNAAGAPTFGSVSLTADVSGKLPIANGGTNSSTALAGSSIMISNGSAVVQGSAGTTTTVLHGNAGGAPTYGAVVLTADVSGVLPLANGGTNADLSATGGTSQVLKQTSTGGAVTVGQLAASDLSNGTTGTNEVVLKTSPALTTPNIGVATGTSLATGTLKQVTGASTSVGGAATTIFTLSAAGPVGAVLVTGDSGAGASFTDLVSFISGGTPVVLASGTTSGAPAARTYTTTTTALKLAMGAGTYTVKTGPWEIS